MAQWTPIKGDHRKFKVNEDEERKEESKEERGSEEKKRRKSERKSEGLTAPPVRMLIGRGATTEKYVSPGTMSRIGAVRAWGRVLRRGEKMLYRGKRSLVKL